MEPGRTPRARLRLATLARVLLGLAGVAAVIVLVRAVPVDPLLRWLTAQVDSLGIWGAVAFGGMFAVLTLVMVPATPVALAAGAVLGSGVGAVTIAIAATLSSGLSYALVRTVFFDRVARRIHRYRRLHAVYAALARPSGWKLVIAVRLCHALPFGLQNLLFGISPIRTGPYLLATFAAIIPWSIAYTYLGSIGAAALRTEEPGSASAHEWAIRGAGLTVAVLALFYIIALARRIIRDRAHFDITDDPLRLADDLSRGQAI